MILDIVRDLKSAADADDFHDGAKSLLKTLGYESGRLGPNAFSPEDFVGQFKNKRTTKRTGGPTQTERGFLKEVISTRILFQMTDDEVNQAAKKRTGEMTLFESGGTDLDPSVDKSFFFASVELNGDSYPRGKYAEFTREINKRLPIATVALFRTQSRRVSIALADRREHKNEPEGRAVLGRVSLLREIDPANMRSDANILEDLTLNKRIEWMQERRAQHNFDGLRKAWLDTLDTESLNKRFYKDLKGWFDRVVGSATFPVDEDATETQQDHAIRLITRMLFIWFMKEKKLVNESLFVEPQIRLLLKNYKSESGDSYYRAVLQNLFFATLNTPIQQRAFRELEDIGKRYNKRHRVSSFRRYEKEMENPDQLCRLLNETPFINGGLFECLDDLEAKGEGGKRVDCFTDHPPHRDQLSVPNRLFFDSGGLIPLLEKYKFTLDESTPIEQEVALDPELLGNVFENLLAEMNPETRDTARKMTGSYYTPRAVVNYMTKEALAAALAQKVQPDPENAGGWNENLDVLLDDEEEWDDAGELFSDSEKQRLKKGIADLKILDPAVGSGAFPMAALLKLTMALRRLEPDSAESDYDRKLSLIQNNIFGVDKQRIACQIAKLRFFITLAVEQDSNNDSNDNFGFKPLPNLETRFVAADALLPLHPPGSQKPIEDADELAKKNELEQKIHENYQRYFLANERDKKKDLKDENEDLRGKLSEQLRKLKWEDKAAERIANWDAFSQTDEPADWFDPEYMFGVKDGFDVVIGNPPYVQLQKKRGELANRYQDAGFETFARTGDIYCLFYEQALNLAADSGCACLITSNKWMRSDYGKKLRGMFVEKTSPRLLVDMGPGVFEASVDTNILLFSEIWGG